MANTRTRNSAAAVKLVGPKKTAGTKSVVIEDTEVQSPRVKITRKTKKPEEQRTASDQEFDPNSLEDDVLDAEELGAPCNKPEQIVKKPRKTRDKKVEPVRTNTMKPLARDELVNIAKKQRKTHSKRIELVHAETVGPLARDKDHVPHTLNINFPLEDWNDMSNRLQGLELKIDEILRLIDNNLLRFDWGKN
jgi:hypothetical protein